ncbi:MAG: ketopantoate reductase family protein [Candidatus Thorarchaeota archaeon]
MNIAIVGIGAIGTIIAANFAKHGYPIHAACREKPVLEAIKKRGLKVSGVSGDYIVKENIVPVLTIEELPDTLDLVIIITKLNHAEDAINRVENKLSENGTLMIMSNGMLDEKLQEKFKANQLLSCVISFAATRVGPAESVKTTKGEIVLGRIKGEKQEIDELLLSVLSNIEPTSWSDNILNVKFTKLLINTNTSSFGMISGMTLGEKLKRKGSRLAFLAVLTEGIRIAQAKGINLQRLNQIKFETLALTSKELKGFSLNHMKKQLIMKLVGRKYKNLYTSSLVSLSEGEKTEVDYLNGYLVEQGEKYNIETPLNRFIVDLVHKIEMGETEPSLSNLILLEEETRKVWGLK